MNSISNQLRSNIRTVSVEMINLMESIEESYKTDLRTGVNYSMPVEEFDDGTFNDLLKCIAKLDLLYEIGLISSEEYDAIKDDAYEIRHNEIQKFKEVKEM